MTKAKANEIVQLELNCATTTSLLWTMAAVKNKYVKTTADLLRVTEEKDKAREELQASKTEKDKLHKEVLLLKAGLSMAKGKLSNAHSEILHLEEVHNNDVQFV